jgi:5-methylcytosine-specific restriction endonuclease McrA
MNGNKSKSYRKTTGRRIRLWEEAGGKCCYCGRTMPKPTHKEKHHPAMATIEHIIPLGFKDTHYGVTRGFACSCAECNRARGQIPHEKFMEIRNVGPHWREVRKAYMQMRNRQTNQHAMRNLVAPYRTFVYI